MAANLLHQVHVVKGVFRTQLLGLVPVGEWPPSFALGVWQWRRGVGMVVGLLLVWNWKPSLASLAAQSSLPPVVALQISGFKFRVFNILIINKKFKKWCINVDRIFVVGFAIRNKNKILWNIIKINLIYNYEKIPRNRIHNKSVGDSKRIPNCKKKNKKKPRQINRFISPQKKFFYKIRYFGKKTW
jgi:hypothetical protein